MAVCVQRTDREDGAEALLRPGDNFADVEAIHRERVLGEAANEPRRQVKKIFFQEENRL